MRKKLGKMLSILLSAAMLMGSVNVPVMAAEVPEIAIESEADTETVIQEETEAVDEVTEADDEQNSEQQVAEQPEATEEDEVIAEPEETIEDEVVADELTEEEIALEEAVELEEDEVEIQASNYTITFLLNGEECLPDEMNFTWLDNCKPDDDGKIGNTDLIFCPEPTTLGFILNVKYKVGASGTYKTMETLWVNSEFGTQIFYKIPKKAITGDVYVNIEAKEYFMVPISFNDGEGSHFTLGGELSEGYQDEYVGECGQYFFNIIPDEGYKVAGVTSSVGNIYDLGDEYVLELPVLWEKPERIDITAIVYPEGEIEQKISTVYFDSDAAEVIIKDSADGSVIEPYSVSKIKDDYGRVNANYLLQSGKNSDDTYKKYSIEINLNDGYSFNEYGVGKSYLMSSGSYSNSVHTNQNSKSNYNGELNMKTSPSYIFYSNTKAAYTPVVKVQGATPEMASGAYKVSYLDEVNLSIKKATSEITPSKVVVKSGSTVLDTYADKTELSFAGDKTVYGKTLTVDLYDGDTKAATTKLQVSTPITSVTLKNTAVLKPVMGGAELSSDITVNTGANVNKLAYEFVDENGDELDEAPAFVTVTLENGTLKIQASSEYKAGKEAKIVLYDSENTVAWNEQKLTNGTLTITTTAPAWAKSAPGASMTSASDIELGFKATAPSSLKTLDSTYYVKVKLSSNKDTSKTIKTGLEVNDAPKYFQIVDGEIPAISVYAFATGGTPVTELGAGCATKIDAEISIVKTKGNPTEDEENILASTPAKKLTVSTKAPYYTDKITLKKTAAASKLYAGQSDIKIADVNLGSNTTYNTKAYWGVTKVVSASGVDARDKISVTQGADNTGIYATVAADAPAGKYKVTVSAIRGGQVQVVEATMDITVLPTISQLTLTAPSYVYQKPNSATTVQTNIVAKDQDGKIIKNPAVIYTIIDKVASVPSTSGITIDKKGKITIAKGFTPNDESKYYVLVKAYDYNGNNAYGQSLLTLTSEVDSFNKIELYNGDGELLNGKTVAIDEAVVSTTKLLNKNGEVVKTSNRLFDNDDTVEITWTPTSMPVKPTTMTFTAKGIDGSTAKASINITYKSDSAEFNKLVVKESDAEFTDGDEVVPDGSVYTRENQPSNEILMLSLVNADGSMEAYDNCVEGSLSVSGAKVLKNYNNQKLYVQLTAPTATVTLSKKVKNESGKEETAKTIWTINNDSLKQVKAPDVKSALIEGQKVYAKYIYNGKSLVVTLKSPVMDADQNVINAEDITVECDFEDMNPDEYIEYAVSSDNKTATVTIPMDDNTSFEASKFSFNLLYKDRDGKYLTKAPTVVSVTPAKFAQSFKLNATQNMSLKDANEIKLAYTGKGVESVKYSTTLLNVNKKGVYNEFAAAYKLTEDGTLSVLNSSKIPLTKKGECDAMEGYVMCTVTYESGDTADFLTKITVKWSTKETKKYTYTATDGSDGNGLDEDGKQIVSIYANGNPVAVKAVKYSKKVDAISKVEKLDDGKIGAYFYTSKEGSYKIEVLIIPEDSAFTGENASEDDFAKYGIEVPITLKLKF